MFLGVTTEGIVRILAMGMGTPTSFMLRLGSGEITVRAEKLTRLPDRLPLNLPSLPFKRWERVLRGLPDLCLAGGIPETELSKNVVT